MSARVLVVVVDPAERAALAAAVRARGCTVATAESVSEGLDALQRTPFDILFTDLQLPGASGLELLAAARTCHRTIVITDSPVDGLTRVIRRAGAYACCRKPFDMQRLTALLGSSPEAAAGTGLPGMVGRAPAILQLQEMVHRVGNSHATVLIEGESGTGKELVARAIHTCSPRAHGPFVAVNCAALSAGLLESELFGHERGAFTGAHRTRRGRFELADGGTLLLDEIGEMPPGLQAKLLRALEEMEIVRVGGSVTISVDVRVVAATNRPLRERVKEGAFREDLFYRLNVVRVQVPPLRERPGDVPLLVDSMLDELAAVHGVPRPFVDESALRHIASARWRGNVRELRNFVERTLLTVQGGTIRREDLPADLETMEEAAAVPLTMRPIAEVERELVRNTLRDLAGNRESAAAVLGISTRTLYRRIKELGLS